MTLFETKNSSPGKIIIDGFYFESKQNFGLFASLKKWIKNLADRIETYDV